MTSLYHRSYTPFQKEAIKEVAKLVGNRAFRYEKAQNNHLKVFIEGVEKPVFTSSTPSDGRCSLLNFLSQVRGELRVIDEQAPLPVQHCAANPTQPHVCAHSKMIKHIVKTFRSQVKDMEMKERAMVLETQSVNEIPPLRLSLVKQAINARLKQRKNPEYVKPSEMRCLIKDVLHHVNFMLPDLACYAQSLQEPKKQLDALFNEQESEPMVQPTTSHTPEQAESDIRTSQACKGDKNGKGQREAQPSQTQKPAASLQPTKPRNVGKPMHSNPELEPVATVPCEGCQHAHIAQEYPGVTPLLAWSTEQRIEHFKQLPLTQLSALLDELQQARTLRHEDDLQEVMALIQHKGLDVQELFARLQQAA